MLRYRNTGCWETEDPAIEQEFERITQEWLMGVESSPAEIYASQGLDEPPMDVVVFLCIDASGRWLPLLAFNSVFRKKDIYSRCDKTWKEAPGGSDGNNHLSGISDFARGWNTAALGSMPVGLEENSYHMAGEVAVRIRSSE